jgi:hypothetical protein
MDSRGDSENSEKLSAEGHKYLDRVGALGSVLAVTTTEPYRVRRSLMTSPESLAGQAICSTSS